jgi:hypothetical protein
MRNVAQMAAVLALAVFMLAPLAACEVTGSPDSGQQGASTDLVPDIPREQPGIRGLITQSDIDSDSGSILVEEDKTTAGARQKASVRISGKTRIYRRIGAGFETVDASVLTVDRPVTVWFDGPVAESYPVQGNGAVIVVGT